MNDLKPEQQRVLAELAPYWLGEGRPNPERPTEEATCRSLSAMGLLSRRGRRYRLTERGRARGLEILGER